METRTEKVRLKTKERLKSLNLQLIAAAAVTSQSESLKLESDLTPIPGILKPQHHAADEEPELS